jgi:hypothetical protein
MAFYRAFHFYSPLMGCEAVRLSMVDARGGEFYRIVPRSDGKAWRDVRDRELDLIEDAIAGGAEPGEVDG